MHKEEPIKEARPNPSSKNFNPENHVYDLWKKATGEDKAALETHLLALVKRHVGKVCWMVLHSYQPHLISEIAQDVLLDIEFFREESAFSSWVHARALNRLRNERAAQIRRKEVSLDSFPPHVIPTLAVKESTLELRMIVKEMVSSLSSIEQEIVKYKISYGYSDAEIGKILGYSRPWVQMLWSKLRKKLRRLYHDKTA